MNYGFKLPEIVRMAEASGDTFELGRLSRSKKFQIAISAEAHSASIDYARQMRTFGIYRLPFPECYFEIVFTEVRLGYLCWEDSEGIVARPYQWWQSRGVQLPLYSFRVPPSDAEKPLQYQDIEAGLTAIPSSLRRLEWQIKKQELRAKERLLWEEMLPHDIDFVDTAIGSLSLNGAIAMPTKRSRSSAALRRISAEYFSHSVISVPGDSGAFCRGPSRNGGPCERAHVRLHWRRGHIRRLPNNSLTNVKPCLVGDRRFGAVSSEYVISSRAA